ncbi:hypothetical protein BpHYR1_032297 [Brachionus plicatilis]|uniref:Uncharacterized protein n=1 Tax=Brachionus plicatilis TaxID=10195 RepID=A0A3M7Q5U0_BRAPC|nr:hypothetical protein BpHYR1_032297 [Brachionus plicatilis]
MVIDKLFVLTEKLILKEYRFSGFGIDLQYDLDKKVNLKCKSFKDIGKRHYKRNQAAIVGISSIILLFHVIFKGQESKI